MIDETLRNLVQTRALQRCEYCHTPQSAIQITLVVDHIIARQHGGNDNPDNLALCCPSCNRKKGPNLAGIDPFDQAITPLFHPRKNLWNDHFRVHGSTLTGITPQGRATIVVLGLNEPQRVALRASLLSEGMRFD